MLILRIPYLADIIAIHSQVQLVKSRQVFFFWDWLSYILNVETLSSEVHKLLKLKWLMSDFFLNSNVKFLLLEETKDTHESTWS